MQRLSEIEWFAEPNLENAPPAKIAPLALFPQVDGILGIPLMAVNQLLGYLVAYRPRLFLAAIVAGSWIGWSWQRRLARWRAQVTECGYGGLLGDDKRTAA